MFHGKLAQLPKWTKMEHISSQGMAIRYSSPSFKGPVVDESAMPVISIPFEPPLETTMDARKRLVAMSESCEKANAKFAQAASPEFWSKYNMDVLLRWMDHVLMHPATLAVLAVLAILLASPSPLQSAALNDDRRTDSEQVAFTAYTYMIHCVHTVVHAVRLPLQLLILPLAVILFIRFLSWLSSAWSNAAPMPNDIAELPTWVMSTLLTPTLPPLTPEQWREEKVVITGGARGLGAVLARRLADKGAHVITLDVAKSTVKHANVVAYRCDISKQNEVLSVTRNILHRHGAPTMLINNAAVRNGYPLLDVSVGDIARVMDTNTMAHFWTLKEFLPSMVEKKRGHIVTVSSMMGQTGVAQMVDYVASKHALVGLHDSLRFELDSIYKTPFVRTTIVTTGHLQETSMFSGIQYNAFARFFAPPISTSSVAEAVVDALESQESRTVALPWYAAWTPALRLLPSFARDGVQALLGANHSMTTAPKAAPDSSADALST